MENVAAPKASSYLCLALLLLISSLDHAWAGAKMEEEAMALREGMRAGGFGQTNSSSPDVAPDQTPQQQPPEKCILDPFCKLPKGCRSDAECKFKGEISPCQSLGLVLKCCNCVCRCAPGP